MVFAFSLYLVAMLGIGIYFAHKDKVVNEKEFLIGGRKMGKWVTAISELATETSAFIFMGLPAAVLLSGVGSVGVWLCIGCVIGSWANWHFIAPRLLEFSKEANDSVTIPQFLSNRFKHNGNLMRIICAVIFIIIFTVYAATGFKACGFLLNNIFGLDITISIIISAVIILSYTMLGGYKAVCYTDLIQGILMGLSLLIIPILGWLAIGSFNSISVEPAYWSLLPNNTWNWTSISTIISGLAWGLGYFGLPHVLVRFMSAKDVKTLKKSKVIALSCFVFSLAGAVAIGLIGRILLPDLVNGNASMVFVELAKMLCFPFLAGLVLAGVLAASMSTADSQLLVSATSFANDIYKPLWRKKASDKEMVLVSRLVILAIVITAILIATNPNTGTIMDLVGYAWGGFGAAFGSVIILSLFWKRFNYIGAVCGILTGAIVDVLWIIFLSASTGIYEIIPGFIASMIVAVIATKMTSKPNKEVEDLFDKSVARL